MPHVAFVSFTGLRICSRELLDLGMTLPGLRQRGAAIEWLPSLGLLTLAGMTPGQWTCSYHESDRANGELISRVCGEHPTLVAVSALTASILEAYDFSAELRRRRIRTVLGGLHATTCADEAGQHFDAVVVGDGEPVWGDVLRDAHDARPATVYRPARPFDLARSPVPRYDLLGAARRPRLTLQTQRGCPLACDFCAASRLLGPFREKPAANIRAELDAIRSIEPRPIIELADDNTLAGNRDHAALLDEFERSDVRYFTECDWRIGEQPELLARLAASGCVQVLVGVESLVAAPVGFGPKAADLPRMMDALLAIQAAGIAVIGCFIVGCDGETRASIDALAEFLNECPLADVQVTLQTPFPGTALRRRLERAGRILPDRDWSHYTLFDVTFQPDAMSVAELECGFRELVREVYRPEAVRCRQAIRRQTWRRHPKLGRSESEPLPLS